MKDVESNKVIAALSYVGIICFVPLLLKRNSKFAQWHAKQGLILFIVEVIAFVLNIIPGVGFIIMLIAIIFSILGIKAALEGRFWKMPFVHKYVGKLNL